MLQSRQNAINDIINRPATQPDVPEKRISQYFGENVFGAISMRGYLPEDVYKELSANIDNGERVSRKIADQVATSMKAWAMERGVTHYTHWFQPLTGRTAEKHDAFFDPIGNGRTVEQFGGEQLVQQEPDASSFPNGGLRNTFEARGYTAWDPTSPAFIIDKTLCIPTVFVAYTGEALDNKTPLLKSIVALEKAALPVCQMFDRNVTKVQATLGWEQEYFLVDKAFYYARPDLVLTGRTLFGGSSSKGQQLDDHYFGAIPDRVTSYMREFEAESLKLGIPVKTRHNEVAPGQYECAPVYEEVNRSVDHNILLMDIMEKVAEKHNLKVLFHEKPFAGINGSGKHNNWSMSTDTGVNLLSPGKTPTKNLRFLTFFVNTIKAVHDHADMIRATIATAGNDHRLGANEAPPAIISVFIGSQLTKILDNIETKMKKGKMTAEEKTDLKLNIGKIPDILLDNTDRNRTSPFAFTGNKFELRAVGSDSNCASPMTVINTIVANQLAQFRIEVAKEIKSGTKKDEAILAVLQNYIKESKAVRFEGDGYGDEWHKEAEKRGLPNLKTTPEALGAMVTEKSKELFKKHDIMSEGEMEARHEINLENYKLKIQIESRVMSDMVLTQIMPVALDYQQQLLDNISSLQETFGAKSKLFAGQKAIAEEIGERVNKIYEWANAMTEKRKELNNISDSEEQTKGYCNEVVPFFDKIRYEVDKLELIVDNAIWPLPKYREMLFIR